MGYYGFAPYVPVAQRRATAQKKMEARRKKGLAVDPIDAIKGLKIAKTFWGKTWCESLEGHADYSNRLPRGRTYVRNGSVVHLEIRRGEVTAVVSGSELYDVTVRVRPIPPARWQKLRGACAGETLSALEILQGKLSAAVMTVLTRAGEGMVPVPGELTLQCSCPDGASMCKHVAAVLYGVGARLDHRPELLFTLRGVDSTELVSEAGSVLHRKPASARALEADDASLAAMFGIDMDAGTTTVTAAVPAVTARAAKKPEAKKPEAKKPEAKKPEAKKPEAKKPETVKATTKALTERVTGTVKPVATIPEKEVTAAKLKTMGYGPAKVQRMLAEGVLERTSFGWYRFLKAPG